MVFTNSERGGKLDDKNVFGDVNVTLICELLQNNDQNGNDDDDNNSIKYETQPSRRNFLFWVLLRSFDRVVHVLSVELMILSDSTKSAWDVDLSRED